MRRRVLLSAFALIGSLIEVMLTTTCKFPRNNARFKLKPNYVVLRENNISELTIQVPWLVFSALSWRLLYCSHEILHPCLAVLNTNSLLP